VENAAMMTGKEVMTRRTKKTKKTKVVTRTEIDTVIETGKVIESIGKIVNMMIDMELMEVIGRPTRDSSD
jgi:hypothetical protein